MKAVRAAVLAIVAIALAGAAPAAHMRVAVFPFAAHPLGMNDEVLATPVQLRDLQRSFVSALQRRGIEAVPVNARCYEGDDACYAQATRAVDARFAVSAEVTRYMALLWNVDIAVHGRAASERVMHNEYKGDYEALLRTMPGVAADVQRRLL